MGFLYYKLFSGLQYNSDKISGRVEINVIKDVVVVAVDDDAADHDAHKNRGVPIFV